MNLAPREPQDGRRQHRRPRPLDIAIVGMACRFPGAPDLVSFWRNILEARSSISDVPPSRWDPAVFFDPDSKANDRVYCRRGGYLDEPIGFDPTVFGVMPIAVEGGEPEQFLVLDTARAALADAGLEGGLPAGARAEVVIGRGNYFNRGNLTRLQHGRIVAQTLAILESLHPEWTDAQRDSVRADLKSSLPPFEAGTIPAQLTNSTAGRVAERLDLSGASFVVDAASASSLVALDLGARALRDGRADVAIVGGVYLQPDVDFPMVFCGLGALSRNGEARSFADDADGTIPGEGVGVVILKRLTDAVRAGDRIYAVVKGVGLASDGRGAGLAAPSARGHARALRRAYKQSGIDPGTVSYIEGHGLGVPASDKAELRALRSVFGPLERGRRTIGSLTPLIGHAMPAAGIAALIKSALCLHHRVIPPSPGAGNPHRLIASSNNALSLNPSCRPWIHGDERNPRRAGVNAFGFVGANAHAVLEEHRVSADGDTPGALPEWDSEAILLGARDRDEWVDLVRALLSWLDTGINATVSLKDLAFTLNTGLGNPPFRVGIVATSTMDLVEKLRAALDRIGEGKAASVRDTRGVYFWQDSLGGPGKVAFLYPGEGSQYPGMLGDLCPHFPEVREKLDIADRIAAERGLKRLPSEELFDPQATEGLELFGVGTAVNVVLSTQWALHQLLTRLQIQPDAVVGHSSGEFIALAAAGVVGVDRGFEDRLGDLGTLFERLESEGAVPAATLVAVAAKRERVEPILREINGTLIVAIDNCPHQVVIAGDDQTISQAVSRLRAEGFICEQLPFHRAYHTPEFNSTLGPVKTFFDELDFASPIARLYSCATAVQSGRDPETIRDLAVRQWVSPVAFRPTVEAMYTDGVRIFVEVGARGSLTGYVEDTLRGRPHFAIAANLPRRSGLTQLNQLVASLFAQGVPLRPDHLYARRRPKRIELSRDIAAPSPVRPLAVGFPEMRLSTGMIETLREIEHATLVHRNGPAAEVGHGPLVNGPAGVQRNGTGHSHSEGQSYSNGHASAVTPRWRTPVGTNGSANGHVSNGSSTHDPVEPFHADSPSPLVPGTDAAMLAFFRTMDDFLDTQRDVLESYERVCMRSLLAAKAEADSPTGTIEFHVPGPGFASAAAVDPVSPAEPAVEDVQAILIDQVARRTGYPREMLGLDLDMEADLGIDSIKRVEILGEVQERGLVPAGVDMDRLSRCRTMGQVVELLRRSSHARSTPYPRTELWGGTIESCNPGRELVAIRRIDTVTDPVAAQHTLGGRRISAVEPGRLGLPVIPFTVMAELLAQAAAVLVPGKKVLGFRNLQAHRWIRYEDAPFDLEVKCQIDPARPDEVRATLQTRGSDRGKGSAAVEGVVVFGETRGVRLEPMAFSLGDAGPCRFEAGEIYRDQWLFHGQALQAVCRIGAASREGIEGALRVLPRRELLSEAEWPVLHTDPIVLDAFTHILGCWGLDKQAGEEGDVMFPLRLDSLTIHGADPEEGEEVSCRIHVRDITRHKVRVDADLVAPDGRVWVAIRGWEDWRFYWPGRYRDCFRMPEQIFVGEAIELLGHVQDSPSLTAVWLEPPSDMLKPVWGDVLEWVQLAPDERDCIRREASSEVERRQRILERIAAKEAMRRVSLSGGEPSVYPADLVVLETSTGRNEIRSLAEPGRQDIPAVAMASCEGLAVAVASPDAEARLGVAIESQNSSSGDPDVSSEERRWLGLNAPAERDRDVWNSRLRSARVAATRALGSGEVLFVSADVATGAFEYRPVDSSKRVARGGSDVIGDHVWAWARAEGDEG